MVADDSTQTILKSQDTLYTRLQHEEQTGVRFDNSYKPYSNIGAHRDPDHRTVLGLIPDCNIPEDGWYGKPITSKFKFWRIEV